MVDPHDNVSRANTTHRVRTEGVQNTVSVREGWSSRVHSAAIDRRGDRDAF
jgi:hypothetical protein